MNCLTCFKGAPLYIILMLDVYRPMSIQMHCQHRLLVSEEAPDQQCCLRGLVCCLRHGQPPTPPQRGARDDWRRTRDRPDTHPAGTQTLLFVVMNRMKSRWRRQRNGLPLAPMLFNIYTNDQPVRTRRHSQLHLCR